MSFGGGGTADYRINYIITTSSQGAGAGPINQVAAATDKLGTASMSAEQAQNKLAVANNKVSQANLGVSKAAKGLTFGILGITTAGAEMMGMLSMWQQTQIGVKEAQQGVNDAIEDFGKGSQQHKQALQEVAKANRWAQMTQRNLMLSMFDMIPFIALTINGLAKLKTALAAKAAAAKELALVNATLSRSELGLAASTKTAGASMLLNANGMNVASKSAVGFRASLAAVGTAASGLLIKLAPLLAILAAISAATILYANNIGGLKAAFDSLGVALGNAIPQLKGVLTTIGEIAAKLGKGDIQGAIDVLMQKVTGETALEQISKKDEEATKKLLETYERAIEARLQLFSDLAHMDKKERKEELFDLGIKGGAGKRFKDTLDDYEIFTDTLNNFGKAWDVAQHAMDLKSLGFKVPDSMFKKIEFTFAHRFNKLDKMIEGPTGEIFSDLSDALEKDAKKGGKNFNNIMLKYFKGPQGAELIKIAESLGMTELTDTITTILDGEEKKIMDAARKYGTAVSEWYKKIPKNPNSVNKAEFTAEQIEKLPDNFVSQFPSTLGKSIKLPDIEQNVNTTLKITDGKGYNFTASSTAAGSGGMAAPDWLTNFFKDKLFNVSAWQNAITTAADPSFWAGIHADIGHHIDLSLQRLNPNADTGTSPTNMTAAPQWAVDFYNAHLEPLFNADNWLKAIQTLANPQFWADVTKALNDAATNALNRLDAANKADESRFDKNAPGSGGMGPSQWIYDTLAPWFNPQTWLDQISKLGDILKPQVADGMKTEKIEIMKDWWKTSNNTNPVTPGDKSGKGLPKSFTDQFPSTYGTPIADIPKLIIKPDIWTPDLSGATPTWKPQSDNPGKEGSGIPGSWGSAYALYIDYPGTAVVTPASTVVNIDWANIMTSANIGMVSIGNGWITLMTNMSSLANTTVQAIALVFGGMVINISAGVTGLAATWSAICNSFGANAQSGANQITTAIEDAMSNAEEKMSDLADHWSSMCNSLINNAEAAADGINDALDSIEDEEVKITYKAVGSPSNPVGKAHGTEGMWVHKPTLFMAGEQGSELVEVTRAHSKSGTGSGNGGDGSTGDIFSTFNGTVNLKISGNEIINPTKLSQKIKMTVGENRDRFG